MALTLKLAAQLTRDTRKLTNLLYDRQAGTRGLSNDTVNAAISSVEGADPKKWPVVFVPQTERPV